MTDRTAHHRPSDGTPSDDAVVFLSVSRRTLTLGLAALVLLGLSLGAGALTVRLFEDGAPADRAAGEDLPAPPPVTFVPPTAQRVSEGDRVEVSDYGDPARGPENAPVIMIEFSDYQCQFCGTFARETLHPLLALYGDQIRFVYRDFVIFGPLSLQAALSAECADEQDAFWPYHDRLFEQQNNLSARLFFALAEELDLDGQQFARCVSDPAMEAEVKADTAEGPRLGIRGTPTFYVNGRVMVGAQPLDAFATVIDEELARAAAADAPRTPQDAP